MPVACYMPLNALLAYLEDIKSRVLCVGAGKPLVVGEFGSQRPMSVRNGFYQTLYEELAKAKSQGLPVAGALSTSSTLLLNQHPLFALTFLHVIACQL